ncbi:MFS transporter [Plantactinospora sp. BC1]|nr:MFS transporter [Plantactinospora sp. BC1]
MGRRRPVTPVLSADFGRLWAAQAVSQVAAKSGLLVLPLLAVLLLDASPGEVGLVNAAQYAPVFVVTLLAGAWLDGRARRPAMLAAHLGRALLLGLAAVMVLADAVHVWLLAAIALQVGCLTALADVAAHTYLPTLVPAASLPAANSRLEATYSVTQIAAPGLGGIAVGAVGGSTLLASLGATYAVAAACLYRIRQPEPPAGPTRGAGALRRIHEGARFTAGSPPLRSLMVQAAWFNLFEQVILTVYLVHAVRFLHFSPGLLGVTVALGAVGAVCGSALARRIERRVGIRGTLVRGMAVASAAPLAIPLTALPTPVAAALCTVTFLAFGFGLTVFNVYSVSLRQRLAPDHLLGRVTATFRFVTFGTIWIGALVGGVAAELLGTRPAIVLAAAALLLGWVHFAIVTRRVEPTLWTVGERLECAS